MSQRSISSDWLDKFSDPYAVLGVAVTADDRRVQKRYRKVAMWLHPDRYVGAEVAVREVANEMLMRVVNPAYEKLKQEKIRAETAAMLRFQVRRISQNGALQPQSDLARQLMSHPASEVDVFYEQAVVSLADSQYQPIDQFETITLQLSELNLVYLQLKMGEVFVRERPTGIVPAKEKPIQVALTPTNLTDSYARRHYKRAQQYMKNQNWQQAVQELRDAIKLEADKSEFHALLGVAYLQQKLTGMATVYLRQALKLNPDDPLASRYAAKLGIKVPPPAAEPQNSNTAKSRGLFGLFRSRK